VSWLEWPAELILRAPPALAQARHEFQEAIGLHRLTQFLFFRQWDALKDYAHGKGVRLIGDVPIFVASDSADVWAHPEMFLLDAQRRPTVVSGVPPDYFSATGQLWGNPLYNWEALRKTGYGWWIARLRATLRQVDLVRLDHFRGFEAYWEVPAGMPTAELGKWVKAPGADFFATLRRELEADRGRGLESRLQAAEAVSPRGRSDPGQLPLIAEDLGVITPEVEALRLQFNLPGMSILQFGFGGASEDRFLPHNYEHHTFVYTGTHDNDTIRGWFATLTEKEHAYLQRYLPGGITDISWDMIRLAWMSVATYALAPLQDVLGLGNEARMNLPGRASGNWGWRFTEDMLTGEVLERLGDLTEVYHR
jgi:4-alpha-glucanotransferase